MVVEVDPGRIEDVVAALEELHRLGLQAGHVAITMVADGLGAGGDLLLPVGQTADVIHVRMGQDDLPDRAGRELLDGLLLLEGLGRVVADIDQDRAFARVDEEDRPLALDLVDRRPDRDHADLQRLQVVDADGHVGFDLDGSRGARDGDRESDDEGERQSEGEQSGNERDRSQGHPPLDEDPGTAGSVA